MGTQEDLYTAAPGVLPGAVTRYIGRRREGAELRALLESERLVTLTGPGGVGKTRLALATASSAARSFADGSCFVGLAELRDAALLVNIVAGRLGLTARQGEPLEQTVLGHLGRRHILLVLDNCEHLIDACADFAAEVLAACPGTTVLATSRQSLRVAGERVVRTPALAVPDSESALTVARAGRYDGVRLFVDRATAVEPSFALTRDNCAAVAEVCRHLDGLPLAIELASARMRSLSPKQLVELLAGGVTDLLATGPRSGPPRQRTLRSTMEWSHGLCSPAEQALWRRASVFAGSFPLDAAARVCAGEDLPPESVLDAVDGLIDKSVLLREEQGDEVRYRMLESLREYGHAQAEERGELRAAALAHRDWIDRLTLQADAQWVSARQLDWVGRLRLEQANLRAALNWTLTEPGEAGAALGIAARLDEYWKLIGCSLEAETWLERALDAAPPDDPDRPFALAVAALHALWRDDVDCAGQRLAAAARLPQGPDAELLAAHRSYVSSLTCVIGPAPGAAELAAEAAAFFRARGDVRRELHPLFIHGVTIVYRSGDMEAARTSLRRMLRLSRSCGEWYSRAMALFGIATVEVGFGEPEQALAAAREGVAICGRMSSVGSMAYHLEAHAWIADRTRRFERAAVLFGAAASAWAEIGADPEIGVRIPHGKHTRSTREAIGPARYERLHATGRALSRDEAVRFALEQDPGEIPAPADELDRLTEREREIAELVGQGLTNRDVAARLVISRRTVDTHVQRVLGKLGLQNRTQIASLVHSRQV
ncbi:ATP-binding protein [Streptomyces sp. KLOTTS4A1]|uniref:ATP-binding protein n=1 Tax=Streptomyces sp. KLOTTS4A1 TaxID=3390996 RepID=UPI0039F4A758